MIAEKLKPKAEWYEWLLTYQELCNEIEYLEFELNRAEIELKRWVYGDLQELKLQEGSLGGKVEENIEKLKDRISFKREQRDQLIHLVNTFKGLDHKILKLRYVNGLKLDDIADELNYSASHIKKRHAELMRTIGFLKKYHLSSL
jgi:DNA-directed RNA polymerase specialized sigma subunit